MIKDLVPIFWHITSTSDLNFDREIKPVILLLLTEPLTMYGLILSNFTTYMKHKYGEEAWDNIRRLANVDTPTFSVHKVNKIKFP